MKRLLVFFIVVMCAGVVNAQVMINEFLYDTVGRDDSTLMYTELYGPPGTDLANWALAGINGNGGTVYRVVTLSGSIPADGYFVIGNRPQVTNVDLVLNTNSDAGIDWQNAGSSSGEDCDGLDLRNASGTVVDHICYGTCSAGHICTGEGNNNAQDPFPSQGTNYSLARIPDHSDTDNNGVDWVITDNLTPGAPNSGEPCNPVNVTLAQVRQNNANGEPVLDGQFVVFTGVVNVDNYTLDSLTLSNFYVQDEDAGVNVYRGTVPAGIVAGMEVTVSGWVDSFRGLTEIVSSGTGNCLFEVEITGTGTPPSPAILQCNASFESYEGMLATIEDVTIVDGDWPPEGENGNLTITDGTGTITLRIVDDTEVDGTPEPQGAFDVTGVITQFDFDPPFDAFYQITARYPSDIQTLAADEHSSSMLAQEFRLNSVYPNPFNSSTRISFEVGTARELSLVIYDLEGREVMSEQMVNLTPGSHEITWSPAGASGLYLVALRSASSVQSAKLLYLK